MLIGYRNLEFRKGVEPEDIVCNLEAFGWYL